MKTEKLERLIKKARRLSPGGITVRMTPREASYAERTLDRSPGIQYSYDPTYQLMQICADDEWGILCELYLKAQTVGMPAGEAAGYNDPFKLWLAINEYRQRQECDYIGGTRIPRDSRARAIGEGMQCRFVRAAKSGGMQYTVHCNA